jgi:hypothetical protein
MTGDHWQIDHGDNSHKRMTAKSRAFTEVNEKDIN